MIDAIQFTVDKFTFSIASDRLYTPESLWAKPEPEGVRVGLSDYLQQRSGDIAFVEVKPSGTEIKTGDEIVVVETFKVNIGLGDNAVNEAKHGWFNQKKVGIIACSGEELAQGTMTRLAAL